MRIGWPTVGQILGYGKLHHDQFIEGRFLAHGGRRWIGPWIEWSVVVETFARFARVLRGRRNAVVGRPIAFGIGLASARGRFSGVLGLLGAVTVGAARPKGQRDPEQRV